MKNEYLVNTPLNKQQNSFINSIAIPIKTIELTPEDKINLQHKFLEALKEYDIELSSDIKFE